MLRISKLADYAILIVSYMAKQQPSILLSAADLAKALYLTQPTTGKILKALAEVKLVKSIRGVSGGYHLAKTAKEITISDIISAMEGTLAITACCDKADFCSLESTCMLRHNWKVINKKIQSFLATVTIHDILEPISAIENLR